MLHRQLIAMLSICAIILSVGCSKPIASGTVHVNDTPVASGEIRFTRKGEDQTLFSTAISSGEFTVEASDFSGDVAGDYEVSVHVHFLDSSEAEQYYTNVMTQPAATTSHAPQVFEETLEERGNVFNYKLVE